jgi:hypothetical protein
MPLTMKTPTEILLANFFRKPPNNTNKYKKTHQVVILTFKHHHCIYDFSYIK